MQGVGEELPELPIQQLAFNSLFEMHHSVAHRRHGAQHHADLSILYLRCGSLRVMSWIRLAPLSILYLRCSNMWGGGSDIHNEPFNSLFEMLKTFATASAGLVTLISFNSLFEMLEVLVFGLCGFLSVSVVVLGFAVVCFVLVLWGCLFVYGGVGGCGSCLGGGGVRRRLAVLCCTTFYKLDLRFT